MRSRVAGAAAAVLLAAAAGCSGDGSPETEPEPTAASAATSDGAGPSPTATSSTTGQPGRVVDTPELTYRLPGTGWRLSRAGYSAYKDLPTAAWSLGIGVSQSFSGDSSDTYAELALSSVPATDPPVERRDDRTAGGVEGFVLESSGPDGLFYEFGAVVDDRRVYFDFEASEDTPAVRRWIDHVLGSVEWK